MILVLRSTLFHICWYGNIILQMLFYLPVVAFLSRAVIYNRIRFWVRVNNFLHYYLCGTKIEISGVENIPKSRGCIIAAKHQSVWEFYGLISVLSDPCFVLKYELMKIPFFSLYVRRTNHIPIKRSDGGFALRKIINHAKQAVGEGRQVIIFIEGTRTKPGDQPKYQKGIAKMYEELDCEVVPCALNSGMFWGKNSYKRRGGTLKAKFLPAMERGLGKTEFLQRLEQKIETACNELY